MLAVQVKGPEFKSLEPLYMSGGCGSPLVTPAWASSHIINSGCDPSSMDKVEEPLKMLPDMTFGFLHVCAHMCTHTLTG